MAIKLVNREWANCLNGYQYEYIADTESDVANLPECCTGSTAFVIATGVIYIVNASGDWVVLGG